MPDTSCPKDEDGDHHITTLVEHMSLKLGKQQLVLSRLSNVNCGISFGKIINWGK